MPSSSRTRAIPLLCPVDRAVEEVRAGEGGDERVGRARDQLLRAPDLPQAAVDEDADPAGQCRGVLEVVRDEERGDVEPGQELLQLAPHRRLRAAVERRERLVEEQYLRVSRERAREGNALALAARELARGARRRGARSRSARGTRPPCAGARTRCSGGPSGAGRARSPGRGTRRRARPPGGRSPRRVEPRSRRRPRCALPAGARARRRRAGSSSCPRPDGPTSATVRSTSSVSRRSKDRSGTRIWSRSERCHERSESEGQEQDEAEQRRARALIASATSNSSARTPRRSRAAPSA